MYLALYRKYRPRSFEDVISQPHITTTLKREVMNQKTAHAYLFTGPRGTGKTTCSQILSMAVNCLNPIDGNPCLECEICKGIESGSILDVVEIDAASNNGVDNIRQLRDEAAYTPSQCKYRVYIIDETHMLSAGAFNALLKIMEEPPEHVKFILATTEAHKVPATILSRCQRFDFRRIRPEDIKACLLKIAENEPFTLEEDAAFLIARLADGGMRDALSLLDQCVAFSNQVTVETVVSAAGVVGREYLFELTDCMIENNPSKAVMLIDKLYSMSKDLQSLLEEMLNHFRNIMLTMTLKNPSEIITVIPDEQVKINEYTKKFTLSQLLYDISQMQESLDKMSKSSDKRLTLELCFIKLCTPSMNVNHDAFIARLEQLENKIKAGIITAKSDFNDESVRAIEKKPNQEKQIEEKELPEQDIIIKPQAEEIKPKSKGEFIPFAQWADVLAEFSDTPLYGVLNNSRAFTNGGFLYIDTPSSFAGTMMKQEGNAQKVIEAVENKTGIKYRIRLKSAKKTHSSNQDKLSELLDKAKQHGVKINEE